MPTTLYGMAGQAVFETAWLVFRVQVGYQQPSAQYAAEAAMVFLQMTVSVKPGLHCTNHGGATLTVLASTWCS